jgi:tetratricopeptide (TPR) repeat protein
LEAEWRKGMIGRLKINDQNTGVVVDVDLDRLKEAVENTREFLIYNKEIFFEEVESILEHSKEKDKDIKSCLEKINRNIDSKGKILDYDLVRNQLDRIIDSIDYMSKIFVRRGFYHIAAALSEVKAELPTPYEITKDEIDWKEVERCKATRRMEVGRHYFTAGENRPKREYFKKAIENFEECIKMKKRYEIHELSGTAHVAIGVCYGILGNKDKAMENFNEALEDFIKLGIKHRDGDNQEEELRRLILVEIAEEIKELFLKEKSKDFVELGEKTPLEIALGKYRKFDPDHYNKFVHHLGVLGTKSYYTRLKKKLEEE